MTQDDVLTLARAGFTAQQIMALSSVQAQTPAPAPAPAPVAPIAPAPAPAPVATAPAPQPVQTPYPVTPQGAEDPFTKLFEQMTGIKQAIQTNNMMNSVIQPQPQTTDDILASIIQPSNINKEETK